MILNKTIHKIAMFTLQNKVAHEARLPNKAKNGEFLRRSLSYHTLQQKVFFMHLGDELRHSLPLSIESRPTKLVLPCVTDGGGHAFHSCATLMPKYGKCSKG